MRRLALVFLAVSSLAPLEVQAYPIFYACSADGHARDYLDTKEIQAKVLSALANPSSDNEIDEICKGEAECFAVLKQALLLTQVSAAAANEVYERDVRAIQEKMAGLENDLKIDPAIPATAKNLIVMANSVNECRKSQLDLPWSDFAYQGHPASDETNGWDLFIQHGVDNEYNFVSGIGKTDGQNHKTDYDHIGTVIRQAVASNVDPYAALAVAYLEAGRAEPFTVDPAPAYDLMGCEKVRIATYSEKDSDAIAAQESALRSRGTPFLYNYGTFYSTKAQVSTSPAAQQMYRELEKLKSIEGDPGEDPGFACVQTEGAFLADTKGNVVDDFGYTAADAHGALAMSKACCMKIPYISDRVFSLMANNQLGAHLKGAGNDPAKVLQAFNGKGVIGLTEQAGVGAFRFGMRMGTQPQYGAQGMDFVLNSFMNNPAIRKLVESAEKDYGKTPPSILCTGKGAGTYAVDSEKYVNLQRGMKRLDTVIGREWSALSRSERKMVEREYEFVNALQGVTHPKLSRDENARFQAAIAILNSKSDPAAKWSYYRSNVYPFRDTLGKTSMRSWARFDDSQVLEIRRKILAAPAQK